MIWVDRYVTQVGLYGGTWVRDGLNERVVPDRLDAQPALAEVFADEEVDWLSSHEEAARILGVHGDAAHLAGATALAAVRLRPALAEVLADPDAIAAGAGDHGVGRAGQSGHLGHVPALQRVGGDLPGASV